MIPLLAQANGSGELADIRDPVTFYSWMLFAGLALVALAVLLFVVWWVRRRARRASIVVVPPPIAPAVWARSEFDRIAAESSRLDDKAFTSGVSDILRAYLERAFEVPAPERTTEEFLQLIGDHPVFQGRLNEALDTFLRRSDLVKFARQSIDASQRAPMLDEARQVVEEAEELRRPAAPVPGAPPVKGGEA